MRSGLGSITCSNCPLAKLRRESYISTKSLSPGAALFIKTGIEKSLLTPSPPGAREVMESSICLPLCKMILPR